MNKKDTDRKYEWFWLGETYLLNVDDTPDQKYRVHHRNLYDIPFNGSRPSHVTLGVGGRAGASQSGPITACFVKTKLDPANEDAKPVCRNHYLADYFLLGSQILQLNNAFRENKETATEEWLDLCNPTKNSPSIFINNKDGVEKGRLYGVTELGSVMPVYPTDYRVKYYNNNVLWLRNAQGVFEKIPYNKARDSACISDVKAIDNKLGSVIWSSKLRTNKIG